MSERERLTSMNWEEVVMARGMRDEEVQRLLLSRIFRQLFWWVGRAAVAGRLSELRYQVRLRVCSGV